MSMDRHPDGTYRLSHFIITRAYRRPKRGPADQVADGWTVEDPITGAKTPRDTLSGAEQFVREQVERETQIAAYHPKVVRAVWNRDVRGPWVELYLVVTNESPLVSTITGEPRVYFGLMASSNTDRDVDQILRYHGIEQTGGR